ncbi:MAG: hypothetical protein BYD32DRAFT_27048 [Podila humilis]|nr:MAG: hypothetical protein BYD32DRAFT_27048 [Podila humilis]
MRWQVTVNLILNLFPSTCPSFLSLASTPLLFCNFHSCQSLQIIATLHPAASAVLTPVLNGYQRAGS